MKKAIVPAIVEDKEQKFTDSELEFTYVDDSEVTGYGRIISHEVAHTIINAYREHVKDFKGEVEPFGITFGKKTLLSILSQKGCEGIRFYFGKRDKSQWEEGSPYAKWTGTTLVAIGVDADDKEIGTNGYKLMDSVKGTKSIKDLKASSSGVIAEICPPIGM
jgi:hypothetical protein